MPKRSLKSGASATKEEQEPDEADHVPPKRSKKRKIKQDEDFDAIAQKLPARTPAADPEPLVRTTKDESVAVAGDTFEDAVATDKVDWVARRKEKAQRKQERAAKLDEQSKAAIKAKLEEQANREAMNKALKEKGKLTKKQKYLAAKAAKKAQAQANEGKKERARFDVEETLAALKIKKLDPRAVSCFLTGLPYLASEEHVAAHFADVGPNKVQLLRDQGASRPNGTGFVTFTAAEHALRACTFSGSKLQGRWIKVRLCEPRDNGLLKTMDGPGVKPAGCLSAVIKCDASVSEASLWKLFEDCQVSNISCLTDKDTGEFRGTAFMDFDDTAMVDKAVKKSGQSIKGLPILVRYKEELQPKVNRGGVAPHNRAPPVPPPAGTKTTFDDASDSE
mmetsp:Transcript_96989/g.274059  ORF Transcript_96989/g.274059 Transcript_96989/m.274059 type:complete len:392 (-) Transcript_96989:73-1248(-)